MLFGSVNITAQGTNIIVNGVTLNSTEGTVFSGVTIERRGNYTYLTYSDGVRVKWDEATVIDVTVDESFKGKVNGLCGDYDGDSKGLKFYIKFLLSWVFSEEEEDPWFSATLWCRVLSEDSFIGQMFLPTTTASCSSGRKAGLTQSSFA